MTHVLVKFNKDWADEFDVDGFAVMSNNAWLELAPKIAAQKSFYFGTNEGWDSDELCEDETLLDSCIVTEISENEATMITKLFGLTKYPWQSFAYFGVFPTG